METLLNHIFITEALNRPQSPQIWCYVRVSFLNHIASVLYERGLTCGAVYPLYHILNTLTLSSTHMRLMRFGELEKARWGPVKLSLTLLSRFWVRSAQCNCMDKVILNRCICHCGRNQIHWDDKTFNIDFTIKLISLNMTLNPVILYILKKYSKKYNFIFSSSCTVHLVSSLLQQLLLSSIGSYMVLCKSFQR